jgi:hypothetical protein
VHVTAKAPDSLRVDSFSSNGKGIALEPEAATRTHDGHEACDSGSASWQMNLRQHLCPPHAVRRRPEPGPAVVLQNFQQVH